eukprot:scaffold138601_cov28-Attheya_sp.AAC.1
MRQTSDQRPIIFQRGLSNKRKTYLIIPPSGDDEGVWAVYLLQGKEVPSEWEECSMIDFVIDPDHLAKGQTPSPLNLIGAKGHLFIPVSPDDRHLGGAHKDASALIELVLGPWLLNQLKEAFPYMIFQNPREIYQKSKKDFDNAMQTMETYYYILGGLPRYLTKERAPNRSKELTPDKAAEHSRELLKALAAGNNFSDWSTDKIVTHFFTLRTGEDENGYNPDRIYARLDFVSPGAIKAAGRIILSRIQRDVVWRGSKDASDIGLAFERVVLLFLAQGTKGMKSLGLKTRCKRLLSPSQKREGGGNEMVSQPVEFLLNANHDKIEEAPNNAAFEAEVMDIGAGMTFCETGNKLASNKILILPPDGYSNFDGMAGADLGFNVTLQKSHSVSGHDYIRQRQDFGLQPDQKFAHVFVVPPDQFDKGWNTFQNFSWTGDQVATNRKRRKVKSGATTKPAPKISDADMQRACQSMLQFALTIEIEKEHTNEATKSGVEM